MPTGYTSDLYDGKDQSFPEFILYCARAFGALIEMKEEPADATIPDEFIPSEYHAIAFAKANAEYQRLVSMSEVEAAAEAIREADLWDAQRVTREATRVARKARYEAMLAEVMEWEPPTSEHVGLRDFMFQQLTESIEFDCHTYEFPSPQRDGATWREGEIDKAIRDIKYHTDEHAKDVKNAATSSAWVQALRRSLA